MRASGLRGCCTRQQVCMKHIHAHCAMSGMCMCMWVCSEAPALCCSHLMSHAEVGPISCHIQRWVPSHVTCRGGLLFGSFSCTQRRSFLTAYHQSNPSHHHLACPKRACIALLASMRACIALLASMRACRWLGRGACVAAWAAGRMRCTPCGQHGALPECGGQ